MFFYLPDQFRPKVVCIPILLHERTSLAFMKSVARPQLDAIQFDLDKGVTWANIQCDNVNRMKAGPCKQYTSS